MQPIESLPVFERAPAGPDTVIHHDTPLTSIASVEAELCDKPRNADRLCPKSAPSLPSHSPAHVPDQLNHHGPATTMAVSVLFNDRYARNRVTKLPVVRGAASWADWCLHAELNSASAMTMTGSPPASPQVPEKRQRTR